MVSVMFKCCESSSEGGEWGVCPFPVWVSRSLGQPFMVVEQGNYHVIVYHVYSGVQHPMISMLLIL